MIYFDSAATTFQKPKSVSRAVYTAMQKYASPGRGGYDASVQAAGALLACREEAERLFDCPAEQVVFTMNATHGLNMAIRTLVKPGGRVVISGFEHNAVWRPLRNLGADIQIAGRKLFDPTDTLAEFERTVGPGTDAVICTHVSNVFGYILPVKEIAALCRRRGVPFILDASQSAGVLPVSMKDLQAAFIAMPGHKGLYGPQGTGLLLCAASLDPLICGGTGSNSALPEMPDFLPDRGEAGTHNVPGICGLLEGMRFVRSLGMERIFKHETGLVGKLVDQLSGREGIRLFAGPKGTQSGVLSLILEEWDCEEAAEMLRTQNCAVRAGLQCAPLAHESAGTLDCGTIRVSPSVFSTEKETVYLSKRLLSLKK